MFLLAVPLWNNPSIMTDVMGSFIGLCCCHQETGHSPLVSQEWTAIINLHGRKGHTLRHPRSGGFNLHSNPGNQHHQIHTHRHFRSAAGYIIPTPSSAKPGYYFYVVLVGSGNSSPPFPIWIGNAGALPHRPNIKWWNWLQAICYLKLRGIIKNATDSKTPAEGNNILLPVESDSTFKN